MTWSERQSLLRLSDMELKIRLNLIETVISEGISEAAGMTIIKELLRQRDVIKNALQDKIAERKKHHSGIVVQLKPLYLKLRRM